MSHISDLGPLVKELQGARRVLLTTHAQPDGDGLGSELALSLALRQLGREVTIWNADPTPHRFRFLDPRNEIRVRRDGDDLPEVDFGLVLDTHSWEMLGSVAPPLQEATFPVFFLDHHPCASAISGRRIFGTPEASSTGELTFDLIGQLGADLDPQMAECLYVAISYDTNSFKYIRSQSQPLEIGAKLIRHGVDTDRVYRHLFASNPAGKIRVLGQLLSRTRFTCEGRVSYVDIPHEFITSAGVETEAWRDVVTQLLEVDGVEVAVAFKEPRPDEIKVSFRSKGSYVINTIAEELGGGGHAFAAGAELDGKLADVKDKVLEKVCRFFGSVASPNGDGACGG